MTAFETTDVGDPIPPGPAPVPPGPGVPVPDPPAPTPGPPWPDPLPQPQPSPDEDVARGRKNEVVVELRGSVALLSGVVERAGCRESIEDRIAALPSISRVESDLRPSAA